MSKVVCITGALSQAGSYLAELLIAKGNKVIGVHRRSSVINTDNLTAILDHPNFTLECGDITDYAYISSAILRYKPDEIYNCAAQSHVKISFDQPFTTFEIDTIGVLNILEAVRLLSPHTRVMQYSTSEMFGSNYDTKWESPSESNLYLSGGEVKYQNELTRFQPESPYAIAKLAAHELCGLYRRAYNIFVCCNINFNFESPRRGKEFVTRKITDYIGRLVGSCSILNSGIAPSSPDTLGFTNVKNVDTIAWVPSKLVEFPKLKLGNLDACRDWGHAKDTVRAAWLCLQQDKPDDYVIATGKTYSIREFLEIAFSKVGLNWKDFVEVDSKFMRPSEVPFLRGDASKAKRILGWEPSVSFDELVTEMVESDIKKNRR